MGLVPIACVALSLPLSLPLSLLWGERQEPLATASPPPAFLSALAEERGWRTEMGGGGRWVIHGNVEPRLMRAAVDLVDHFFRRLDETIPPPEAPAVTDPVLLLFLNSRADQEAVCAALGENWPHLREWASTAAAYPYFDLYAPLLALVRLDASTAAIQRMEVQLAHMAVPLELARRCGRQPFWVGEALGYALQEEKLGGVYGYTMAAAQVFEDSFHVTWRQQARSALLKPVAVLHLMSGKEQGFDRERACAQMGVARYWLSSNPQGLARFMDATSRARGKDHALDRVFEPPPSLQAQWLDQACGTDWMQRALEANPEVAAPDGRAALAAEVKQALEMAAKAQELKAYTSKGGRLTLWSDFDDKAAKSALKAGEDLLRYLDAALGTGGDDRPLTVLMVRGSAAYQGVCDAIAAVHPGQARYLREARSGTGFTVYDQLLSACFHDPRVQEEADPKHSVVHNLVHLDLNRRYGSLPLWLAEGVACAGEDAILKAVYGNWYRHEFVSSVSHGGWRETSASVVGGEVHGMDDLFAYSAREYDDELAHLAFAFALYGLEKEPKAFAEFLNALAREREATWTGAGRFEPRPVQLDAALHATFGADFERQFEKYWKSPPKRR